MDSKIDYVSFLDQPWGHPVQPSNKINFHHSSAQYLATLSEHCSFSAGWPFGWTWVGMLWWTMMWGYKEHKSSKPVWRRIGVCYSLPGENPPELFSQTDFSVGPGCDWEDIHNFGFLWNHSRTIILKYLEGFERHPLG
ncbi:unnamed protein product [Ranitomeya imitator]|uniref:Uncharacterized protein n=1 Tax=Ranitomeya imitator TaxID=111125 RepID=A0ABN9M654_9NEOB|nr:unnamed protein product [Ranitomeya imitator]